MKKTGITFLLTLMMISMAGCGSAASQQTENSSEDSSTVQMQEGPLDGSTFTYDELKKTLGWEMTLVFEDGMVTKQEITDGKVSTEASGTYEVDGSDISITIDGGTEKGTINDDQTEILIDDGAEGTLYHK